MSGTRPSRRPTAVADEVEEKKKEGVKCEEMNLQKRHHCLCCAAVQAVRTQESNYWLGGQGLDTHVVTHVMRVMRSGVRLDTREGSQRRPRTRVVGLRLSLSYPGSEWDFDKRKWKEAAWFRGQLGS